MTSKSVNKLTEPSKTDLIRALCALEGELQAKDIVIGILKTEQVRRLLHPCYNSFNNKRRWITQPHSKLSTDTIIPNRALKCKQFQLQQQQHLHDSISSTSTSTSTTTTATTTTTTTFTQPHEQLQQQQSLQHQQTCKSIQLNIEPSDPYAALLRDTYCAYDPSYDDGSTKIIFNLQYQNLRTLIDHQRRVRKFLISQINEWESKYRSCWTETEKAQCLKYERDKMIRQIELLEKENRLLKEEVENVKKDLLKEKEHEKSMIMCLVTERKGLICRLIEQNQHNNSLIDMLTAEQCRAAELSEGLEEESKRSLQLESELERLSSSFEKTRSLLMDKINDLENESTKLKEENDKLKTELEAIKPKGPDSVHPSTTPQTVPKSSPGKSNAGTPGNRTPTTQSKPTTSSTPSGNPSTSVQKKLSSSSTTSTGSSPVYRGAPPPIPPNKPILPPNALKERSKEIQQATVRAKMMTVKPTSPALSKAAAIPAPNSTVPAQSESTASQNP